MIRFCCFGMVALALVSAAMNYFDLAFFCLVVAASVKFITDDAC